MNNSTLQMTRRLLCHHLLLTGLLLASAICPTTAAENKGGGNAKAASAQSTRQSAVIEGVIKDADGAPIVGATVAVKGSAIGALTDAGGHYILNNVPAGSILSVSYVGMKPQEITVGNAARQTINVKMEMDAIDEVVVVAFGTQKKESIVSSIETINPKELKVPSSNLTTALAGRMSGVIAYQRSGEPGADGADFFIRGVTSFGYKVDPLILIDGIDIRKIKISSLRRHFGQMLQDVFLFSGTIRSNIVLREENIPDEEIMKVCRYVNADHFINKLEHGLDEEVRERGNNFSAGQRQLLSFARTILHKPSVMILDEATANIDTETELLIQDSLEKMRSVGTMLIVAHRLSTIQHADNIIVLSRGRILEQGTHQQLLAAHGRYYQLYTLQYHKEQMDKQ